MDPCRADGNDVASAIRRGARGGVSVIGSAEADTYQAIEGLEVPDGGAHLVGGMDVG